MPIVIPIEVQVPPESTLTIDFLQSRVSQFAQSLVDEATSSNRPHRQMTWAEVEANSISLEESERRLTERIHRFYQHKA